MVKYSINWNLVRSYLKIASGVSLTIGLHHYFVKSVVIVNVSEGMHEILFKFMLFCYFQAYNQFMYYMLCLFFDKTRFIEGSTDAILIFLKYFVSDVVCSTIASPLLASKDNRERLIGLINFTYQMVVYYGQKNYLVDWVVGFVKFVFNFKKKADVGGSYVVDKEIGSIRNESALQFEGQRREQNEVGGKIERKGEGKREEKGLEQYFFLNSSVFINKLLS